MSFFTPSAAWLFLLALPLIALYFLKLNRPRVTVPSLVLWRRVLDDQRVNSPFQRFKRNLLLLLQLLLLLLLILAAMQPFFRGQEDRITRLPVLVDCSASMGAVDQRGGESRLDAAKKRVEDLIAGLLPDQQLALISFSDTARQRSGFTSNKQLLKEALAEIEVEEVPSQIEHAVRMAQALGRGATFDEIVLLSDGNVPGRADLDLPFRVNFQQIESSAPNLGITACTARRGRDEGWEVFVEVGASVGADYGGALTMREAGSPEGETLASELVTTKAGQAARLLFEVSGNAIRNLEFELIPNASNDALEMDNVAYLRLPALRPLIAYVPESLASFRHALSAIDQIDVYPNKRNLTPERFDLLVGTEPDDVLRMADVRLLMGMVPLDLESLIRVESPSPNQAIDWRRDALLLQHVDFSNVVFLEQPIAADLQEGTFVNLGYEVLLFGGKGPLILEKRENDQLNLHTLFHPDRSTFPYRVGFPVFISNLVQLTRQEVGLSEARGLATGILPGMQMEPSQSVVISGPRGEKVTVESDENGWVPGVSARAVGTYQYGGPDETRGASLLSMAETSLAQVETVEFREASVRAESTAIETERPIWHWLAAIGLLVLLLEWWVFQRRPGGWTRPQRT